MTNFLTGTNRGLGGLRVDDASTDVFGVNHIVFSSGATLTDNGNGKVSIAISGGGGGGMNSWTVAGASGSSAVGDGQTVTITGSDGITTAEVGRTVTVTPTGVLEDLNTLGAPSADGEFIVATGAGAFAYESGATVRTSLGLGTIATQNANLVAITGGSITGITDLAVADGGTGLGSYTAGDILYASGATTLSKLSIGTAGQVLAVNGGATAPEWVTGGGGGSGTVASATIYQVAYYTATGTAVGGDSNMTFQPTGAAQANRFAIADDFLVNGDIGGRKYAMIVNPGGIVANNWAFLSNDFDGVGAALPAINFDTTQERETRAISTTVNVLGQLSTSVTAGTGGTPIQAMPFDGSGYGGSYVVSNSPSAVEINLNVNTDPAGNIVSDIGVTGYSLGDQITIMSYNPSPVALFNIIVTAEAFNGGGAVAPIPINGVAGADVITANYTVRTYTLIENGFGGLAFIAVG